MMTIKIFITITTVMSTKVIGRSLNSCLDVYYNNIHKVRNVFVPIDADYFVFICEFCRSESLILISIVIDIDARCFVSFIFIAVERKLCCTRFCLTLIRDILF
jgi:hypothetical protein